MRTKLMGLYGSCGSFDGERSIGRGSAAHCKRPLIQRVASVTLAKQPTLVQSSACPQKAALSLPEY